MWLFVVFSVLIILYWLIIKPLSYWQSLGVPCQTPMPLFGNYWRTLLGLSSSVYETSRIYNSFPDKRYCGAYIYHNPVLIIRDPELVKEITVKNFDSFVDHSDFFFGRELDVLISTNLFSLRGKAWRDMRSTLSPAYTGNKMKAMFEFVNEIGDQFVRHLDQRVKNENGKLLDIEMKDFFTRVTNDSIATCAFGVKCDSLEDRNNEFYQVSVMGTDLQTLKYKLYILAPTIMKKFTDYVLPKKVHTFLTELITETVKVRSQQNIVRPDMIHLLMQAQKGTLSQENGPANGNDVKAQNKKKYITDQDMVAQAYVFLFAGFETISTTLCFMAHELAMNPDVQQKLQNEIDDTLAETNGQITYDVVNKMKYLDMFISEGLRKWSGAFLTDRFCTQDYTLYDGEKSVHLKAGTTLLFPIMCLHRDPKYFPDPEKFDPERFSDENKSKIKPSAYMPFGSGPRMCIGNRFALMECKIVILKLVQHFNIVVTNKTDTQMKLKPNYALMTALNGFWVGMSRRNH